MTKEQRLYNKKYRWGRDVRKLEDDIRRMLRFVKTNGYEARVSTIVTMGNRILRTGIRGEALWQEIFDQGKTHTPLADLADQLGYLEQLSEALADSAAKLLGMEIRSFRRYYNTKAHSYAKHETKALDELTSE